MRPLAASAAVLLAFAVPGETTAPQRPAAGVQIEMRNVRLHADEGIVLDVERLRGVMVSRHAGSPPVFDDQRSYLLQLDAATLSMTTDSLQTLLNRHVFGYVGAPLTNSRCRSKATD